MKPLETRSVGSASAVLAMMVGSVAVPLSASAQTSEDCNPEICDPVGDGIRTHVPGFRDIVCNGIQWDDETQTLFLSMTLADEVPESPPLAQGAKELWFYWAFDLDPTTRPAGYPFISADVPAEVQVVVSWDGTQFTGNAIDRRPLLVGEDATISPVPFSVDGDTITAELDASLFDIPMSFYWLAVTRDWTRAPGTKGSEAFHFVDGGGGDGHGVWTWFESPCVGD